MLDAVDASVFQADVTTAAAFGAIFWKNPRAVAHMLDAVDARVFQASVATAAAFGAMFLKKPRAVAHTLDATDASVSHALVTTSDTDTSPVNNPVTVSQIVPATPVIASHAPVNTSPTEISPLNTPLTVDHMPWTKPIIGSSAPFIVLRIGPKVFVVHVTMFPQTSLILSPSDPANSFTLSQFLYSNTPAATAAPIASTIKPIGPADSALNAVDIVRTPDIIVLPVLITLPAPISTGPIAAAISTIFSISCCAPGDRPSHHVFTPATAFLTVVRNPMIIGAAASMMSVPSSFRLFSISVN